MPRNDSSSGEAAGLEIKTAGAGNFVAALLAASIALPLAIAQAPEKAAPDAKKAATPTASPSAATPIIRTKINTKDGLTYVWIPPGKLVLGCSAGDTECFDDEKKHEVTITSGFWMGQTDVTQEAYSRVMGRNPSHFKGASLPVETVNWSQAQGYCAAVGARLPTEAEWEHAARGGNPASRPGALEEIAWYGGNSRSKTRPVALKKANAYGLYDMLGNVWQWTADWYAENVSTPAVDPSGPSNGTGRTLRGGSWADYSRFVRASEREAALPSDRYDVIGFRCAMDAGFFVAEDQAFPAGGGTESINITFPQTLSWEASSSADWITFAGPASGVGNGTLRYQVASNPGPARVGRIMVGDTSFTVEQQADSVPGLSFIGSIPHIAAQQDWKTTFTLINKDQAAAKVRLSLFADSGKPLKLPLEFRQPIQGPLRGSALDRTLPPKSSLTIDTADAQAAPVQMGSAQLAATGSVDGFAILHLTPGEQEIIVPLETRNAKSYLVAFDNTVGMGLSVAVANASPDATNVAVAIRDDTGAQIGTGSLALESGAHTSILLSAKYPVTANKRGTIEFVIPSGGQVSVLGIRTTPIGTTNMLTAIPVLANIGTGGGSFPHITTGDGWESTFVLVNTGAATAQAKLTFFADQTGAPLPLPLTFPQGNGKTVTASSVTQTLAAGASLLVVSSGAPQLLIGSAQLSTTGQVSGFVVSRHDDQEVVVPLESRNATAYIIAFDNTNGTATGIALNAVSAGPVNIPVTVRDDTGAQIATDTITLAANGHYAFTLATDKYPGAANIRGTIQFDSPAGAQIGALGIRIPGVPAHTSTTLPALAR